MTEALGESPNPVEDSAQRSQRRTRPLYHRLVREPLRRAQPTPGMSDRIRTRLRPNEGQPNPFLADEIRELEIPTVSVDALQGTNRIPPLPEEQQPNQQTIDVQQYNADDAALLAKNREHLTTNERRTVQNIRETRFRRPDLGPDDPTAYEQWHRSAIAAIREDPTANIFLEQPEPQATPTVPQTGENPLQQNVNISPEHPGRFTYTSQSRPLPEGRLHGQISEVGLNNHGELVLMFEDGQVSLLNNRFNTYRPAEGRTEGLPFSITGIRTVNGETMVDVLARGNVVRNRRTIPLDTFLANLNVGRVVLHEGYPLHIGPLRGLNVIETDTPASQAVPGLLPFEFRSSVPGIITDPVTHIGIDAQGELVIRHNTETIWKGNPRGSILGRTILYRDPNNADSYVRLQVSNVSRQENQTVVQFTDRSGNAITVPAAELLNSLNNGTDVDRWQIDRNPNRPLNGGILAPEPPPTNESPNLPDSLAASERGEFELSNIFAAIERTAAPNHSRADFDYFIDDPFQPYEIDEARLDDYTVITPFFSIQGITPRGLAFRANPDVVPFAYTDPSVPNPVDTPNPMYARGEAITDGDGGLLALAAASAETSEGRENLYLTLAENILTIHAERPQLLSQWLAAQDRQPPVDGYNSHNLFELFDRDRPDEEKLIDFPDFDAVWTTRLREIADRITTEPVTFQPYHLRWIEFLAHSVNVTRMVRDMQTRVVPPAPTS